MTTDQEIDWAKAKGSKKSSIKAKASKKAPPPKEHSAIDTARLFVIEDPAIKPAAVKQKLEHAGKTLADSSIGSVVNDTRRVLALLQELKLLD